MPQLVWSMEEYRECEHPIGSFGPLGPDLLMSEGVEVLSAVIGTQCGHFTL